MVWHSLTEVHSVSGRKSINTPACTVSFCHDEMPLASIRQRLATITFKLFDIVTYAFSFCKTTFLETAVFCKLLLWHNAT